MIRGQKIAVWFSCGAASAVAAYATLLMYGHNNEVRILNNPVDEEPADNQRFLRDVEAWLEHPIEMVVNPTLGHSSAEKVWEDRKFMSGPLGAPCTMLLKKAARQHWQNKEKPDWHVLGFGTDELERHKTFVFTELPNVLPVLIDFGLSKADCFDVLKNVGIKPSNVYEMGYPNANCIGCVKATSPTYWNHVRSSHPDVFERRAVQSRQIGARLVRHQGKRVFLDELPASAKGRSLKSYAAPECGIFCEEKPRK